MSSQPLSRADVTRKILVIGDDTRSFLTIVRSLGRQGYQIHVAPYNLKSPALKSKYISEVHQFPRYLGKGLDWFSAIRLVDHTECFDLIIPTDERAIFALQNYRIEFRDPSTIAIPSDRAIEILFDKHHTRDLAMKCGVPVSPGRLISNADTADTILRTLAPPLVVKPRMSYRLDKLHSRARVEILATRDELVSCLQSIEDRDDYLVEALFEGQGVGVSVLARDGAIYAAFQHLRIHEPDRGGGSSYRMSAPLDPELLEACNRMVAATDYTGVAMFEFKQNAETSAWILLEVNARFWGSLPLPVFAGLDFPFLLVELLTNGSVQERYDYRYPIFARHISSDINILLGHLSSSTSTWRHRFALSASYIWTFNRLLSGRETVDSFSSDDPRPGFRDLAQLFHDRFWARLEPAWQRISQSTRREKSSFRNAVLDIADYGSVCFVCQGNICRSPFAERLIRKQLASKNSTVEISSAGIYSIAGRVSPDHAHTAARRSGIDMSDHRSQFLSLEAAEMADMIIVFDLRNLREIEQLYPQYFDKVYLLSSAGREKTLPLEIEDPNDKNIEFFDETYGLIGSAIGEIVSILDKATPKVNPKQRPTDFSGKHPLITNSVAEVPIHQGHIDQPLLITTIHTEEQFDWHLPFSREANSVSHISHLPELQDLFKRVGAKPTYLIDYPIASNESAGGFLKSLISDGNSEIGCHLHPWVNPPFREQVCDENSYPGNLSADIEFEKLSTLTQLIESQCGIRPRTYLAGRYGYGENTGEILTKLGYNIDLSVVPAYDFSNDKGPDYSKSFNVPFWSGPDLSLMRIPHTAAFVGHLSHSGQRRPIANSSVLQNSLAQSALGKLRLLRRIRLSPEGVDLATLKYLTKYLLNCGNRTFVFSFHSPSIEPGHTPYVRTDDDLAKFKTTIEGYISFFHEEIGGRSVTAQQAYEILDSNIGLVN